MQEGLQIYQQILCKFIINLPPEQCQDPSRLSHHVSKAFFYYVDQILNLKTQNQTHQQQRIKFLNKLKKVCPQKIRFSPDLLLSKMQQNKPVCGAIIFNENNSKILITKNHNKYGFPKGKLNQNELPYKCAIREVCEETGIDISSKIMPKLHLKFQSYGQHSTFFIVKGISEDERLIIDYKELEDVIWMSVEDVRKNAKINFVQRSRNAWQLFERDFSRFDAFKINQTKNIKKDTTIDYEASPLFNFQLNSNELYKIIFK